MAEQGEKLILADSKPVVPSCRELPVKQTTHGKADKPSGASDSFYLCQHHRRKDKGAHDVETANTEHLRLTVLSILRKETQV